MSFKLSEGNIIYRCKLPNYNMFDGVIKMFLLFWTAGRYSTREHVITIFRLYDANPSVRNQS